jgi:hypothetical protein
LTIIELGRIDPKFAKSTVKVGAAARTAIAAARHGNRRRARAWIAT